MRPTRTTLQAVIGSVLLGTTSYAIAGSIGGMDVSNGPQFLVSQYYSNVPVTIGGTLAGYGRVDSINSIPIGTLCADCELTYQFSGYTVSSVSPTEIRYSGGTYQYYLGFGANHDFTTRNAGGSAGDLAEATNGTLFLSLRGHPIDAAGNTLVGTGVGIGTVSPTGFGSGLLDVNNSLGGIANPFFDTNGILSLFGGNADLQHGSSFTGLQPAYSGECPGGPACLRGSADATGNATGVSSVAAPPGTEALLVLLATIGGLQAENGPAFSVSQVYQNIPTGIGDTLSGYGRVDSINSIPVGSLCTDCELTYVFGGFNVSAVTPTEIRYTGGWYRYYLGFGADHDFTTLNAGGSAGDLAEASNGTLFLSLMGHAIDAFGNTLVGTGVGIGTLSPTGFDTGLLDVDLGAGGLSNPFFDNNVILALFGGGADLQHGSSFTGLQPPYPGECPGGLACLRGSEDFTGNLSGLSQVPEPATFALFVAGLAGLAATRRRESARMVRTSS
jgi:hypothetical protein